MLLAPNPGSSVERDQNLVGSPSAFAAYAQAENSILAGKPLIPVILGRRKRKSIYL